MSATTDKTSPLSVAVAGVSRRTRSEVWPGLLRAGSGEPLVLLHGVTGSARMWKRVLPWLTPTHDVIAPTALGHRGGPRAELRPARIAHLVDDAERCLDYLAIDRAHLAGNSLGGWMALELARRGRARSVCALSPAGAWEQHDARASGILRATVRRARASRPLLPWLARLASVRRQALQDNALHGERVTRDELLGLVDDLLGCEVCEGLFSTSERLAPLQTACPITIAWSRYDRIFPLGVNDVIARQRVPEAHYLVLDGVGHVPMLDDPQLVARTILASVKRAV